MNVATGIESANDCIDENHFSESDEQHIKTDLNCKTLREKDIFFIHWMNAILPATIIFSLSVRRPIIRSFQDGF